MTRKEIYLFVKSGVDRLKVQHGFGRGRLSEFSSKVNTDYPFVWFETSEMTTDLIENSLPMDNWQINLHIAKLDREDSSHDEYESLIDDCDEVGQSLAFLYNSIVADSNLLRIESIQRTPFIKKIANSVTGVLLSFSLVGPDSTDQSENCE